MKNLFIMKSSDWIDRIGCNLQTSKAL